MTELNIDECIEQLSTEQKIAILSGADFWHTYGNQELGIPSMRVSDGRQSCH